ncbi:hypothetical protein OIU78_026808 [Salix suchowensis]|nr:hypothetical protein OIU78_026808 [Salix suchowensis]
MTIMSFINRASRALHGYPASSKLLVLFTLRLVMPFLFSCVSFLHSYFLQRKVKKNVIF